MADQLYTATLRGVREHVSRVWLVKGKRGNLQTLRAMRALVRDNLGFDGAMQDNGLRKFAAHVVALRGGGGYEWATRVRAIFDYITQQFHYIPDPAGGNENIANARETIRDGWGDCDDLAVLCATLLGMVGVQTAFRAARYTAGIDGFEHVYVIAFAPDGTEVPLDCARKESRIGTEARFVEAVSLNITDTAETLAGLSANWTKFIGASTSTAAAGAQGGVRNAVVTGASIAVNFIPVVGPILAPVVGLIAGLFHSGPSAQERKIGSDFDKADKEVAAYLHTFEPKAYAGNLTGEDITLAADAVAQLAQLAQQQAGVKYVAKQWKMEETNYAKWFETMIPKVKPGSIGTKEYDAAQNKTVSGAGASGGSVSGAIDSIGEQVSSALNVGTGKLLIIGVAAVVILPRLLGNGSK